MSRIKLFDSFVLDGVHRSESGYLAAHAKVARTGIQVYQGCEVGQPDKEKITLYRPPEEVFHVDAMHSMAHRPVTLTHPPVMVDSKNWKKYAKGQTGDEIVRDGDSVRVPVTLMDQATIDAYESGDACEMSMGYTTDIDWTAGTTPQGESYDGVQRNIRANHLAFVPQARGGEKLRFGDGDKAMCHACGASMTMKDDKYICDGCGGTKKYGDWVPVGDGDDEPRDDHGRWSSGGGRAGGNLLRNQEHPTVLGYELNRETLTPLRGHVNTAAPGDYGSDPLGNGMHRMVPSGDVVTTEEMKRRRGIKDGAESNIPGDSEIISNQGRRRPQPNY